MELDFGLKQSSPLDQIAAKKNNNSEDEFSLFAAWVYAREKTAESQDSHLISAFKNITVEYLRDKIGTRKFNCTFTLTLDLSKKQNRHLKNDHIKQWQKIKNQMREHAGSYNYRYYMIPEYTKRGIVHAHGVIMFTSDTYDGYQYDRSRWVRKMSIKLGRNIQWTRVNDLYNPYMPTETNKTVRAHLTFRHWIDEYCHKNALRKRLGHANLME